MFCPFGFHVIVCIIVYLGRNDAAALCMMARDRKTVNIAHQMPLYPMLDNLDTDTSAEFAKVFAEWSGVSPLEFRRLSK